MAISLNDLAANADVREQLRATCDFDLEGAGTEIGYAVEGVTEAAVVARDGAGGVFAVIARSSRVLFVSAEGQAGIVARNLNALVLVVVCPYWRDVLKFSGGGRLEEMRRAAPVLEAAWLDEGGPSRGGLPQNVRLFLASRGVGACVHHRQNAGRGRCRGGLFSFRLIVRHVG
jgi:hypothetical protein